MVNLSETVKQISEDIKSCDGGKWAAEVDTVLEEINKKRNELDLTGMALRSVPEKLIGIYHDLEQHNCIGAVSGIYPAELAGFYSQNPCLKVAQDELRFVARFKFHELYKNFDEAAYVALLDMIGDYLHDPSKEKLILLNQNTAQHLIQPSNELMAVKSFVQSTYFLYIPMSKEKCDKFPMENVTAQPKLGSGVIWNIHKGVYATHARMLESDDRNKITSKDINKMSADEKQAILELAAKIKQV